MKNISIQFHIFLGLDGTEINPGTHLLLNCFSVPSFVFLSENAVPHITPDHSQSQAGVEMMTSAEPGCLNTYFHNLLLTTLFHLIPSFSFPTASHRVPHILPPQIPWVNSLHLLSLVCFLHVTFSIISMLSSALRL